VSEVEITGVDEVEAALSQISEIALPIGTRVVGAALGEIKNHWSVTPPMPDRDRANPGNKPSPYNTYVRTQGSFPRSAFKRDQAGEWQRKKNGAYKAGPRGGKFRATSQNIGKQFREEVHQVDDGVEGILKNEATYAGYVIGHDQGAGDPEQVSFHKATGWPTIEDAVTAAQPVIHDLEQQAALDLVNKLTGG